MQSHRQEHLTCAAPQTEHLTCAVPQTGVPHLAPSTVLRASAKESPGEMLLRMSTTLPPFAITMWLRLMFLGARKAPKAAAVGQGGGGVTMAMDACCELGQLRCPQTNKF